MFASIFCSLMKLFGKRGAVTGIPWQTVPRHPARSTGAASRELEQGVL